MYVCNTDKGTKLIKPLNCSIDKIIFINNLKSHLLEKGFDKIDSYYLSEEGLPYVLNNNTPYVMTDYMDFNECDLSNINNIKYAVMHMANFHKFSQGINLDKNINIINIKNPNINNICDITDLVGSKIDKDLEKKLELLQQMKRKISKQKKLVDFEILFIKNYEYFYKNAVDALEIIHKYNFGNLEAVANKNIMVCHNKLKEENILINKNTYLTNFEYVTIQHFIHDLGSFINRYMRKQGNNCMTLEEIIHIYSKINYIDKKTLPILYALIKFPTRYIDSCEDFFKRRRNFTPISIINQVENVIELREFQDNYISKINLY